jgi:hypothetical protein
MNGRKRWTTAVAGLCLALLLSDAEAHGRGHGRGWHPGFRSGSGIGFYFWGSPFLGSPFWPYYYPPYYAPMMTMPSEPPTYVERTDGKERAQPLPPNYWYYCTDPPGYYPSVATCLREWIPVAPRSDSTP